MALRELLLKLGIDVDKQGVQNADAALGKLKKAAIIAAAAFAAIKAVKAIGGIVDGVRELGDEIDKTSKQLGLGVDELQEWRFAAGLAGVGGQEMSNSLAKLQKNAFEASKGNKLLTEDFKRLGVSVLDAEGNLKNADTLLTEMADGFQGLDNDTEKVALSLNLMGRAGRKLLPLFEDGAAGIADMRKEARELGGVLDQDLIDASVRLTDDQFRAQQAWQGVKNDIAGVVIPAFIAFSNVMIKVAKGLRGPLKAAFQAFGVIFDAFTGTLDAISDSFGVFGDSISALTIALPILGIAIAIFGRKAVAAGAKTAASWILATLPFLLIVALLAILVLAIEDFIVFMKGGDSLIGRFIQGFRKWVKEMGGVSGAIGAIFEKLFKKIFGLSDDTARAIGGVFAGIGAILSAVFIEVPTVIAENLAKAFLFVKDFVEKFVNAFTEAIDAIIDKYNELTDAVADFIQAAAEATGLDAFVDKGAEVDRKAAIQSNRKREKNFRDEERRRIEGFKQLQKEGFGTFTLAAGTQARATFQPVGDAAQQAAAQARFEQIVTGDTNITVSVDAANQTSPAAIGEAVASKINKAQERRQAAQAFQTSR